MCFWKRVFIIALASIHVVSSVHFLLGCRFEKDDILIHDIQNECLPVLHGFDVFSG